MTIKLNKPFDTADSNFIKELRHPEHLSADVKFYALLGTFSAAYGALLTEETPFGKEDHFRDVVRAGAHLAMQAGLAQPKSDLPFYLRLSEVDKDSAQWGVHLYKAMMNDPIARQSWEVDRNIIVLQAKADAKFRGDYDHRVEHGDDNSGCEAEHAVANHQSHRAGFDLKMHGIVRDRLWGSFWNNNEEVSNLADQAALFWKDALNKHDSEYQELLFLEKRMIADLEKDDLAVQLQAMYRENGGLSRRIFI